MVVIISAMNKFSMEKAIVKAIGLQPVHGEVYNNVQRTHVDRVLTICRDEGGTIRDEQFLNDVFPVHS